MNVHSMDINRYSRYFHCFRYDDDSCDFQLVQHRIRHLQIVIVMMICPSRGLDRTDVVALLPVHHADSTRHFRLFRHN